MSVKVSYHPEHNLVIGVNAEPYDPVTDTVSVATEIKKRLTETSGTVHFISDLSSVDISFAALVEGMASAFSSPESVFSNPRVKTYIVGDNELVRLGAKAAAEQDQYGKVPIQIYGSFDEAMAAIKQ